MNIQTNNKSKPTSVVDDDGVEYFCIPKSQFERVRADFESTNKTSCESPTRSSFAHGYRFALERLGVVYFGGSELPEVIGFQMPEVKERKKIEIGNQEYFEDEVLLRINSLPSAKSIWRKS